MSRRFFANSPIGGEQSLLDGPEAHHLIHVMRAKVGEQVTLFDGSGYEFEGIVEEIQRKQVKLRIAKKSLLNRELPIQLTMAVSLPKGERQRILIEKLVEIGATNLVPLLTDRGVARPESNVVTRLQRAVVEACKQCGRNRLMKIDEPRDGRDFFSQSSSEAMRLLAMPEAEETFSAAVAAGVAARDRQHFVCAVGPEGGFSENEIAAALGSGWRAVNLGQGILRAETAAIVMAGYLALANR